MSSYDERNAAQIRLDEMIWKYERRVKEAEFTAKKYIPDVDTIKDLNLILSDLKDLKTKLDKLSKTGGKIGKSI